MTCKEQALIQWPTYRRADSKANGTLANVALEEECAGASRTSACAGNISKSQENRTDGEKRRELTPPGYFVRLAVGSRSHFYYLLL